MKITKRTPFVNIQKIFPDALSISGKGSYSKESAQKGLYGDTTSVVCLLSYNEDGKFKHVFSKSAFQIVENYPKKDGDKSMFVLYAELFNGKWEPVAVMLPTGYKRSIIATRFETKEECEKCCTAHNKWAGYKDHEIEIIVVASFRNAN